MSTNLHWEPVRSGKRVGGTTLKEILGHLNHLNQQDKDYLRGLEDAGIDGALDLIKAIDQHNEIRLYVSD